MQQSSRKILIPRKRIFISRPRTVAQPTHVPTLCIRLRYAPSCKLLNTLRACFFSFPFRKIQVTLFHQHRHARGRDAATGSLHRTLSVHTTTLEQTYMSEECDENDYHLDLDSYRPIQPLKHDHGVALFPVAAPQNGMDLHLLQVCIS